jgi:hypothetical protein
LSACFVPSDGEGGQLYVSYWDMTASGAHAYWSGKPDEAFAITNYGLPDVTVVPAPGGGLSFGARPFRIGDTQIERRGEAIADGAAFYAVERESGKISITAIDPQTGQKLGSALPPRVAATLHDGVQLASVDLQPAPANLARSPLGLQDGVVGSWTVTRESKSDWLSFGVDGRRGERIVFGHLPGAFALMTFPGDDRPRVVRKDGYPRQTHLHDAEGRALGSTVEKEGVAAGWKLVPDGRFWDLLTPRDEAGSAALRRVTDDTAGELLKVARAECAAGDARTQTVAAIRQHLHEITSEELLAGVLGVVLQAARSADALASLAASRTGEPGATPALAAKEVTGPNDQAMRAALQGVQPTGWGQGDLTNAVLGISAALASTSGEPSAKTSLHWETWFGRVRGLAVAALAQHRTPEQRAAIAAFLARWKTTIFAREPAHVRVLEGSVIPGSRFARKEGESPKGNALVRDGEHRYFVRVSDQLYGSADHARQVCIVEYAPGGDFALPAGVDVKTERRCTEPDEAWIDAFLAELSARGVPEWNADAAAELAKRTGLTRAEAILLWAGLPGVDAYGANFIEKDVRERIGLALGEAKIARETFKASIPDRRLSLFAEGAPSDPRDLWDPLAGGDAGAVGRLAAAWIARFGQRVVLREDIVAMVEKGIDTPHAASVILNALLDPSRAPLLAAPTDRPESEPTFGRQPVNTGHFTPAVVASTAMLVPFLFMELPVGDPYRAALAPLVATVRARLKDPWVELPVANRLGDAAENRALLDLVGGSPAIVPGAEDARDDGVIRAVLSYGGRSFAAVVRPSKVPDLTHADLLWKIRATSDRPTPQLAAWAALEELVPAFLARIEKTVVPAAAYEANPLASAPRVVAAAAKRLGLSEAAATLYLQVLTLVDPTAKRVQTFNAWKPAEYKKAEAELVNAKRLVPGKRERAGRETFLPGGWVKTTGLDLPHEAWKTPLYAHPRCALGRMLPPLPLHAMFEAAWKRVDSGDEPKFEEV